MTDFLGDLRALPGFTLGFFGVQLEGAREVPRKELVAGRWRAAIALAFLVWALMVASEDDEAWVGGGIEFGQSFTPKYCAPQNIHVRVTVSFASPRSFQLMAMLHRSWLRTPPLPSVSSPA